MADPREAVRTGVTVAAVAVATVDGLFEPNYARALRLAEIAAEQHPDIVLLPECVATGYPGTELSPFTETRRSRHLAAFQELSRRSGTMVVFGYLERGADGIRNAVVLYDRGRVLGRHYKSRMWPDAKRPYRDEVSLLRPGQGVEVFESRVGRLAVLICYESGFSDLWRELAGKVDFVLTPYNCEEDPLPNSREHSREAGIPSAWADRVGMVWAGDRFKPNLGTAGIVDATGKVVAASAPGVEDIVVGELPFWEGRRQQGP